MIKTKIAELSNLTGISKVSLYNLLKKDEYKPYISKIDGVTIINDTGVALIRAYYSNERVNAFNDVLTSDLQANNTEIISFLQEQLKEKDNQINTLLSLLKNEQQIRTIPLLSPPDTQSQKKPPSLLQRWFKKGG